MYDVLEYSEAISGQVKILVNISPLTEGKYDYSKERKPVYANFYMKYQNFTSLSIIVFNLGKRRTIYHHFNLVSNSFAYSSAPYTSCPPKILTMIKHHSEKKAMCEDCASIVQWLEHWTCKPVLVMGSISS